jgi:hypothetical protein
MDPLVVFLLCTVFFKFLSFFLLPRCLFKSSCLFKPWYSSVIAFENVFLKIWRYKNFLNVKLALLCYCIDSPDKYRRLNLSAHPHFQNLQSYSSNHWSFHWMGIELNNTKSILQLTSPIWDMEREGRMKRKWWSIHVFEHTLLISHRFKIYLTLVLNQFTLV